MGIPTLLITQALLPLPAVVAFNPVPSNSFSNTAPGRTKSPLTAFVRMSRGALAASTAVMPDCSANNRSAVSALDAGIS